jgi:hypothetical protein
MPGEIVVGATSSRSEPIERRLKIGPGETKTLALAFRTERADRPRDQEEGADAPEPAPQDSDPADTADTTNDGTLRTLGFVSAGVGVAGLIAFGIAGSMAKSEFDQIEEECGSQRCSDPKYADNIDSGRRLQTMANVGLVVGAVGLVAGGTMILLGGPKKREGAGLIVEPGGLALGYRGRF